MKYPVREYVWPWLLARNLFKPEEVYSPDRFIRWGMLRSLAGAAVIVFVTVQYVSLRRILGDFINQAALNITIGAVVVALSVGVLMAIVSGSPAVREAVLHRAKAPGKRLLAALAMYVGAVVLTLLPLPAILRFPLLAWYVAFMLVAFWYLARYLFGAEEVHPVLGPLVSVVTVSVVAAVGVAKALVDDAVPVSAALPLTVAGWLTTIGLAVAETLTLRSRSLDQLRPDDIYQAPATPDPVPPVQAETTQQQFAPQWRRVDVPSPDMEVRHLDTTFRVRDTNPPPGHPTNGRREAILSEAVELAMEMDRLWNATGRADYLKAPTGELYRVDKNAAALAYEAISMLTYKTVIVPARHNVAEWHRAAGFPATWRSSRRLAAAIAEFTDGRWVATPPPPSWHPGATPMDDQTAGATAWALNAFHEDDIWTREDLVDLSFLHYRSAKAWAFAIDRRVTARLAAALLGSPAAADLLRYDAGLRDPARDWAER